MSDTYEVVLVKLSSDIDNGDRVLERELQSMPLISTGFDSQSWIFLQV